MKTAGSSWTPWRPSIGRAPRTLYARPTSISRITAAAEGVTLFYGSDGALYLQTADFTITFHSNGGSEVAP